MIEEQTIISYDEYMPQPLQERIRIFNEVSAENRALLMKTHVKRWLAANHSRLTPEQIALIDEMILFITPERYQVNRDREKVEREAEALCKKAETTFSSEDAMQIMSNRADYVPPIKGKNS